ncbi:ROK family transcriptional regulator [Conexibacter sp. CPCC 206217]|uniref:ROK family transcriptional regulator n=1 Tax=Conexibacter sp. CPCC 206217 TaxID=3064574 RepID=UPI00271CB366|nr:ROK family transcriptional regulator [Conexibacter sp. CPCC 206217]MDO8209416.1 ROK family transcriptional regulator [Conexibacter sp. CPCC 206217]
MAASDEHGDGAKAAVGEAATAGAMLHVIRAAGTLTRAELARRTGLARSTVAQRVDALLRHELLHEVGGDSTGGRPAAALAFNDGSGVVLCADLGATHSRLAVCDLGGGALAEEVEEVAIADGPERVLTLVHERFGALLEQAGRSAAQVRGIGLGVPGPVAFDRGEPANPPIMPGWDGFSIPGWFAARYEAPVLVDNDVNIMALGEHATSWSDSRHLLFIKVGTGIGCGIVAGGAIHRGAMGAAGDIGHIRLAGRDETCRCGNVGCLEAVSGGGAIARRLSALGVEASSSRDVVRLVRGGDGPATQLVREAGRNLGEVLAGCVNFFNPEVIVVGGDVGRASQQLLAGVREVIFQRSLPLATDALRVVPSELGDRAGIVGAAALVIEHVLSPAAIDRALRRAAAA